MLCRVLAALAGAISVPWAVLSCLLHAQQVLHDAAKAQKTATDATAASTGGTDGRSEKDVNSGSQLQATQGEAERSGQEEGSGEKANLGKEVAGPDWSVQYDFAHHPHYPVLRLKHAALPKK